MAAKKTKRRTKVGKTKRGGAARKAGARKSAKKATRSAKTGRSKAKRKSSSSSAKKPASARKPASAARRSLQRVSIVAKQVAQQAQTAVSGGVDALREMGENIVDRVGG